MRRAVLAAMVVFVLAGAGSAEGAITPTRDAQALANTLDAGVPMDASFPLIPPEPDNRPQCDNTQDDDGDGLADGQDPGCASAFDNREQDDPMAQCANGEDDDGDGFVDFSAPMGQSADPGCSSSQDDNEVDGEENPQPACGNGTDDDADDLVDLNDPGCSSLDDLDEGSEGLPVGADVNPAATATEPALGGFPTAGSGYLILSSGDATLADDPNESGATGQVNGNAPGTEAYGPDVNDMVQLKVEFTVPEGVNCARLSFRFLSEEFPEFVGSAYNDGFVAELDSTGFTASTTSISAPRNFAFDSSGKVVSINTAGSSAAEAAGTTYDGATPLLRASTPITPGRHAIYLSIFDLSDSILDSAVFVDHLRLITAPEGACVTGASSDETPPETTITQGPAESIPGPTATFEFTSSEPGGGFQCRTDNAQFATCTSPHVTQPLANGRHAFEVRAVDAAGNIDPTPARREFTVTQGVDPVDLAAKISDPPKAVKAGGEYSYLLRVSNRGTARANGVAVKANLPANAAAIYTKGAATCSGAQDLRCQVGGLAPGKEVPIEVRMVTGQISTGIKGSGPGARIAAAAKERLKASVRVTSEAPDANAANDSAATRTVLKAPLADYAGRKPSKLRARAAAFDPAYGWYASDSRNEAYGASNWRGFSRGGTSGYGALQTYNVGWQRNVPFKFDPPFRDPIITFNEMWQATDYQLQVWACTGFSTSCARSEWKTVKDLSGFKEPVATGGRVFSENPGLGQNPFYRAQKKRSTAKALYWEPGLAVWSLGTPGQAYRLRSRWTYWRNRVGPRDEVYQTSWVQMAVVRSGEGH